MLLWFYYWPPRVRNWNWALTTILGYIHRVNIWTCSLYNSARYVAFTLVLHMLGTSQIHIGTMYCILRAAAPTGYQPSLQRKYLPFAQSLEFFDRYCTTWTQNYFWLVSAIILVKYNGWRKIWRIFLWQNILQDHHSMKNKEFFRASEITQHISRIKIS